MPTLACHVCGRVVETSRALESLSADERRCPRCGSTLDIERRAGDRRQGERRNNPTNDPGPPGGIERRGADRRHGPRRREAGTSGGG